MKYLESIGTLFIINLTHEIVFQLVKIKGQIFNKQ